MSVGTKLLQAAAGNAGDPVYVDDVFSTFLYEGTNTSTAHQIQNGIDLSGEGGLVWIKKRDSNITNTNHHLVDTERGDYYLASNSTNAQASGSDINTFNSDGWTFDASTSLNTDYLGSDYVSWTFRKQEKFFDIVTYTGNGTAGRTISHNLGSVPGMMIVKRTSDTENWNCYHRAIDSSSPENYFIDLDRTAARDTLTGAWNNTAPTSTVFTVGDHDRVNANGHTYVAYLFAHNEQEFGENSDEAIIYCDSFTTTSTWGNFKAEIGFEPQWLLVKRTDSTDNWIMLDMMRGVTGPGDQALVDTGMFGNASNDQELQANTNSAESTQGRGGFYSKGYLGNLGGFGNATYIYVAIRRPHKPASEFAATDLFSVKKNQPASGGVWEHTHLTDMSFYKWQNGSQSWGVQDRLRGSPDLSFNSPSTENGLVGGNAWDVMTGYLNSNPGAGAYTSWAFRRAKEFFDVVLYSGTDSDRTQAHNLGVAPELILIKRRGPYNADWVWYVGPLGAGNYMFNDAGAKLSSTTVWNNTSPTASVFSLGAISSSYYRTNGSGSTYVAYLFATVAGISKIGSYTGTGSDVNVDCGFSAGARFILIKRTDGTEGVSNGDWYVYDSVRGIVAGNDPYYLLNSNAAEVTSTDYIDPLSSGFTVTSSAPAALNASSGNYIFLAIA